MACLIEPFEVPESKKKVNMIHCIGTLDRVLSEMMIVSKNLTDYDEADLQTLKHHAEDMKGAAEVILDRITSHGKKPIFQNVPKPSTERPPVNEDPVGSDREVAERARLENRPGSYVYHCDKGGKSVGGPVQYRPHAQ